MSTQIALARAAVARFEIKGSVWSGRILAAGMYCPMKQVRELVSPDTRRLIEQPPAKSDWVPGIAVLELDAAIFDLGGYDVCFRCSSATSEVEGIGAILRKLAERMLTAFGMTPHTLFRHLNQLTTPNVKGVSWEYTERGLQSGEMRVCYPDCQALPPCVFASCAGGLDAVFVFLGVRGTVSRPMLTASPIQNEAIYQLSW